MHSPQHIPFVGSGLVMEWANIENFQPNELEKLNSRTIPRIMLLTVAEVDSQKAREY